MRAIRSFTSPRLAFACIVICAKAIVKKFCILDDFAMPLDRYYLKKRNKCLYTLQDFSGKERRIVALSLYKFVKLLVSQLVSNFRNNNVYDRPSGRNKEQRLGGKLYIINQMPKGKKEVSCSFTEKKQCGRKNKQFSTVRSVNANRVICIPMNVLKNSTHYSIMININIFIKIILLPRWRKIVLNDFKILLFTRHSSI